MSEYSDLRVKHFANQNGPFSRDLDYAVAAIGVFMILSGVYWFVRGRKRFMQNLVIAGMECTVPREPIESSKSEA